MRVTACLLPAAVAVVTTACASYPLYPGKPETLKLPSEAVGDTFLIEIFAPAGKSESLQALYVLDGAINADPVAAYVYEEKLPYLVVGVGYVQGFAPDKRRRDFLFEKDSFYSQPTGNGDAFQAFLTDELIPLIDEREEVDPERRWLLGHSLSGLFALHAAFEDDAEDPVFDVVMAASPALFHAGGALLDVEAAFDAKHPLQLVVSYGDLEAAPIAGYTRELVSRLKKRDDENLSLRSTVVPNAVHDATWFPTFTEGIDWAGEAAP